MILFSSAVFSQEQDTALTYETMTREQFSDISAITDKWVRNDFLICLKKEGIKMSCAHCTSVYLKVVASIDSTGWLISYKKISSKVCGRKMKSGMEKNFMNYFKMLVFPASLRNQKIQLHLGNGLKC